MSSPIEAHLLSTFRAVAATGRISAAARLLHRSQPAVTAQIHQLEEQCGRPLLVRSAQGVTLTEAGRTLLGFAEEVEGLLDAAAAAVGPARDRGGELVLAASTTIAAHVLPRLIGEYARSLGPLRVRIDVGNTDEVLGMVAEGRAPLGLVEGLSRAPRLRLEPFLKDELVAVVAVDAPADLSRIRKAADLLHVPIIWREPGSGTRAVVERALKRAAGRRPPHARDVQIGATEGCKAAALAGLGVAFISRWSASTELALGRLRVLRIAGLSLPRHFSWALPMAEPRGEAGRFLRFARLAAATLSAG